MSDADGLTTGADPVSLSPDVWRASPGAALAGSAAAPGDKSISHRALIFGAMAAGATRITGLLEADDVLRTAAAMRALGAEVEREGAGWRVAGGEWRSPSRALYFGNSGTGCRLTMGAVAGRGVEAAFDGDGSLRSRPMARILEPLAAMGAATASEGGRLPCTIRAGRLRAIDFTLPTPSAQIKSAVLLAALGAEGETRVAEPVLCRDHTERMLPAFGVPVTIEPEGAGRAIRLTGGAMLRAAEVDVPGDPSSAAFLIAAGVLAGGPAGVRVRNVLMNPLRTGFIETLAEMGADLEIVDRREAGGEPVADIIARPSTLSGVPVPASRAPSMIDEYPILAVVAAFATGDTYMPGVSELRVKESDRIAATEAGLDACGVRTESGGDWLRVFGMGPGGVPGGAEGGARIRTHHDHRIAMSFLILGLAARAPVEIDDAAMIATSFPGFRDTLQALGARIDSAALTRAA